MASFNNLVSSFASGMVSPKFNGCSDIAIYKDAVEELINLYPTEEGGARTREAFEGATAYEFAYDETGLIHRSMIPYIDAKGQSYVFVFSLYSPATYDRAYLDVLKWNGIAWETLAHINNARTWYNEIGYSKMQWVYVGDAIIITPGTIQPLVIYRPPTQFGGFALSYLSEYVADRNPSSPKNKLNDAMISMHYPAGDKNTNPNYLLNGTEKVASTGTDHAIWELTLKDAAGNGLYDVWNVALNTYIKITTTAFTAIFKTRGYDRNNTTSAMRADLIYVRGTIAVTNIKDWFISPWDNINGYPKCVSYFNGRLILGGTNKYPSSLWCSRSETIYRFNDIRFVEDASSDASGLGTNSDGDTSTAAFGITQGTTGAFCAIQWLHVGSNGLYVGTTGGVEIHTSGSNGTFKVGNTFSIQPTNEGCAPIQPISFSGALIYVARDRKRIILLSSDGKTTDLTALSHDFIDRFSPFDTIRKIVVNETLATVMVLTELGKIFCVRLNVLTGKWGFAYYEMPWMQAYESFTLSGKIDIALVDFSGELRFAVATVITKSDGTTKGYILAQQPVLESSIKGIWTACLDFKSSFELGGTKVITLPIALQKARSNLGVWYKRSSDNGWYFEEFVSGTFTTTLTLSENATSAVVGFTYRQRIKTLDLEVGGSNGSTGLHGIKRINSVSFRVWNTINFWFGSSDTRGETLTVSKPTDANSVTLKVERPFSASPDRDCRVIIENRSPVPMYFSALVFSGITQE